MSRQAEAVDIHQYYRTGGIDWDRCAVNFDAVGIRASKGLTMDELFPEHVENCERLSIKYFTYGVPDPVYPAAECADFYIELQGVAGHPVAGDVERVGGNLGTVKYYKDFFDHLRSRSGLFDPWYYSNYNITKILGFPNWIHSMPVWWAEYPFDIYRKYRKTDRYLSKNPWKIPKWAGRSNITPMLHQFSDYGDARFYLANDTTLDPVWSQGIKSCDLNVSLIDKDEFLALFDPGLKLSLEERVNILETQVENLESFHF